MSKCVYCGKKIKEETYLAGASTREFPVCSKECKEDTEQYVRMDKKYKLYMYLAIFVAAVSILLNLVLSKGMTLIYVMQILAGFAFLLFPYPISSFESFYSCPIRTVVWICRVIGVFFILFGIYLLIAL
ncbi:hypothetical protein [Sinanaerobacter chloroacetimidivorans]|uniref:Uncharacterized protein n=1 Tax=Sinanaerobacter chloroacetimidivorans TaxID=2818044 RepID=A0A8J7VZY5_9FIRM|nr:hypothetical protein [Sinanaerobacter chloroacetimidivorans]MBR0598247.1 hypothetical protein [Sinanaerobacter chloroacetimidivorans]